MWRPHQGKPEARHWIQALLQSQQSQRNRPHRLFEGRREQIAIEESSRQRNNYPPIDWIVLLIMPLLSSTRRTSAGKRNTSSRNRTTSACWTASTNTSRATTTRCCPNGVNGARTSRSTDTTCSGRRTRICRSCVDRSRRNRRKSPIKSSCIRIWSIAHRWEADDGARVCVCVCGSVRWALLQRDSCGSNPKLGNARSLYACDDALSLLCVCRLDYTRWGALLPAVAIRDEHTSSRSLWTFGSLLGAQIFAFFRKRKLFYKINE